MTPNFLVMALTNFSFIPPKTLRSDEVPKLAQSSIETPEVFL